MSLYDLNKAALVLKQWFNNPSTQKSLTFPFTQEGLIRSLACNLEEGHEALFLLSQLFPQSTMKALQSLEKAPNEWRGLLLELSVAPSSPTPTTKTSPAKPKKDKYVPSMVTEHAQKIRKWLVEVSNEDIPLAVRKEQWNSHLKKSIIKEKGAGTDATNYWFEDIFVHGLCGLNEDELQQVKNIWSGNLNATFHHPSATMKNSSFWRSLGSMSTPSRRMLMQDVLPHLVDTSLWSFKERYYMLQGMLEQAKERSWLFEERLDFWQALGGVLTEEGPVGTEGDLLMASPAKTAQDWIEEQNIPQWNESLQKRMSPPSSTFKP